MSDDNEVLVQVTPEIYVRPSQVAVVQMIAGADPKLIAHPNDKILMVMNNGHKVGVLRKQWDVIKEYIRIVEVGT